MLHRNASNASDKPRNKPKVGGHLCEMINSVFIFIDARKRQIEEKGQSKPE